MAKNHSLKPRQTAERTVIILAVLLLAFLFLKTTSISGYSTFSIEEPVKLSDEAAPNTEIPAPQSVFFSTEIKDANNNLVSATIDLQNTETSNRYAARGGAMEALLQKRKASSSSRVFTT